MGTLSLSLPRHSLAQWFSQKLSSLDMSKSELSRKTGIPRSTIFAFTTTGRSNLIPDAKALGQMLAALQVAGEEQQVVWDLWKESWRAFEADARSSSTAEAAVA